VPHLPHHFFAGGLVAFRNFPRNTRLYRGL
jgi:hypothetical protein